MSKPLVNALVLAAGQSTRMGVVNKLLHPFDGRALLLHILETLDAHVDVSRVMVMTGHEHKIVEALVLSHFPSFECVYVADYLSGIAASLRVGMLEASKTASAVLVCLGDMPLIRAQTIDRVIALFDDDPTAQIVRPVYMRQPGHPVLFDASLAPHFLSLDGDIGARTIISRFGSIQCIVDDPGCVADFDNLGDFTSAE